MNRREFITLLRAVMSPGEIQRSSPLMPSGCAIVSLVSGAETPTRPASIMTSQLNGRRTP